MREEEEEEFLKASVLEKVETRLKPASLLSEIEKDEVQLLQLQGN